MDSGGGGGGEVTQTTRTEAAPQVNPYLAPFMQQASGVAMTPYQPYTGQLVAQQPWETQHGQLITRNVADQQISDMNASRGNLQGVMGGQYLGYQPGNVGNREVSAGTNALLGVDNPYLNAAIKANMGDVTDQFNNTILNNTDATMARSGAFGGSAWQQAQQNNAKQMTESLGRVGNDMRMADYALQAQLQEADVARRLGADQYNATLNTGIDQYNTGLNNQAYQTERDRMLAAASALPGINQYGYQAGGAYGAVGAQNQQQNQAGLDAAYNQWQQQQNAPYQSLDVMGNAIRTIMGSGGTSFSTAPNPNQSNPIGGALGGAMSGASIGSMVPGIGTGIGAAVGGGLGLLGGIL